jgi:transposase
MVREESTEWERERATVLSSNERQFGPVDVARELGIRPEMIRRWRRRLLGVHEGQPPSAEELEIRRLQKQLSSVREERDILKKALAIFSDRRQ